MRYKCNSSRTLDRSKQQDAAVVLNDEAEAGLLIYEDSLELMTLAMCRNFHLAGSISSPRGGA